MSRQLAVSHGSLAYGVEPAAPHTIFVLSVTGGVAVTPGERTVLFGRNRLEVDVCVGEDDQKISRRHGEIAYDRGYWWLTNTGRLPIRSPGSRLVFAGEEPIPLTEGYSPLFLSGSARREHLLEIYVTGADGDRPRARHQDVTQPPRAWRLTAEEKLVLIVLGQRYLLHEAQPQPLTWRQTADQLAELRPADGWTAKRVEHMVVAIRTRLSRGGVSGLTREEVGEPVGNALNDNLIRELMLSTALVSPDLDVLDDQD